MKWLCRFSLALHEPLQLPGIIRMTSSVFVLSFIYPRSGAVQTETDCQVLSSSDLLANSIMTQ